MQFNEYEAFSVSLGEVLGELAREAKVEKSLAVGKCNEAFQTGYLSDFYRVITLIQQQAEIYDIPLEKLAMDKIEGKDLI